MANKIATDQEAYNVGLVNSSLIVSNRCCTKLRACMFGCSPERLTAYDDSRLVPLTLLTRAGYATWTAVSTPNAASYTLNYTYLTFNGVKYYYSSNAGTIQFRTTNGGGTIILQFNAVGFKSISGVSLPVNVILHSTFPVVNLSAATVSTYGCTISNGSVVTYKVNGYQEGSHHTDIVYMFTATAKASSIPMTFTYSISNYKICTTVAGNYKVSHIVNGSVAQTITVYCSAYTTNTFSWGSTMGYDASHDYTCVKA